MGFCNEIKDIRQKCFLSQEAFAKELGVSFATVNRWEAGKTKPTYKTMRLIDNFCKRISPTIFDTVNTKEISKDNKYFINVFPVK